MEKRRARAGAYVSRIHMEAELRAAREQGALQAARSEVSTLQAQVERLATDIDITVHSNINKQQRKNTSSKKNGRLAASRSHPPYGEGYARRPGAPREGGDAPDPESTANCA